MKSLPIHFIASVLLPVIFPAVAEEGLGVQLAAKIRDDYLAVVELDDRWFVELCPLGESETYLAVDSYSMYRDGSEWAFYKKTMDGWQEWNGLLYVRNDFYRWIEEGRNEMIVYAPRFAPVDASGTIRTWEDYNEATNHFQVLPVEDKLRRITVDMDGVPHVSTNEIGIISHLWTDSFRSLVKTNFDVYSGTNLTHSMLFPDSTAPETPELTAALKNAFAQWFRSCVATNGISSTNAVLAVFADDDLDGRMDAFATLNTPPDADGARRWAFCRNMEDGWLFHGLESPASVMARTNEFFRFTNEHGPSWSPHAIVVLRPNPEAPLFPLFPRLSDEPDPVPDGWRPIGRSFLASYEELLFLSGFVALERLPVESIP